MNQETLIQGCLNKDRVAQKQLYEQYKDAMYTIAYRITNDFELASDVLQEAFLQVFRNIEKFRGESTIGAWIKTIVVRMAIKKSKQKMHFEEIENIPERGSIDWGSSIDLDYLEKAIQSLSDGYRAVFTMIEIEGYAHKEVAEILGISEGTSKSQLFYAKKKLREKLTALELA